MNSDKCKRCGAIVEDAESSTICLSCGANWKTGGFDKSMSQVSPKIPGAAAMFDDVAKYRSTGDLIMLFSAVLALVWTAKCIFMLADLMKLSASGGAKFAAVVNWILVLWAILLVGFFLQIVCHWMGNMMYIGLQQKSALKDIRRDAVDEKPKDAE